VIDGNVSVGHRKGVFMKSNNSFVGKVCVLRINKSGVHIGKVVEITRQSVTIVDYVRLWSWSTVKGFSVDALAMHGIKGAKSDRGSMKKIDREEGGEIIIASAAAIESLKSL
jgi:hypothetical protein